MKKYTLIIAEKPDAAQRIATALDNYGAPKKSIQHGVPFYHAYRNSDIIVVPALGHMYTVASKQRDGSAYPVYDYLWVPLHKVGKRKLKIRIWLDVVGKLAEDAENFVDACDFDIEGSIIGYCLLKYGCGGKEQVAKRMKYSTLTDEELQQSYNSMLPNLDFAIINAGLARHEIDWLYGMNLSRALTTAVKKIKGQYVTLSTGRVQGPTLKFLDDREKAIKSFVPTIYWKIRAKILINGEISEFEYERTIEKKEDANQIVIACKNQEGQIRRVNLRQFGLKPPFPFDLGALQSEAYRVFHYSPIQTSTIAQRLYLEALISYPRTSSQKLPPQIDYAQILRKLGNAASYSKQTAKLLAKPVLIPIEGIKSDLAHPAIYPTGNLPEKPLSTPQKNMFDLIVKRFMAVFGAEASHQTTEINVDIKGNNFFFSCTKTLDEGWIEFYRSYSNVKDCSLPNVAEGQIVPVKRLTLKEDSTKPPPRYNPRSLLMKMEKEEIGTKATRAAIIQTLYDRKYIKGTDHLTISLLGLQITDVLEKYCPSILSPELTRQLEKEMKDIENGTQSKDKVMKNAVESLKIIITDLKSNEQIIGSRLGEALNQSLIEQKTIGICPKCHDGKLVVIRSNKTGKRFVGCSNYFKTKCGATFPLPQIGSIKTQATPCKDCGSPIICILAPKRRPWRLCINPNCPSKQNNNCLQAK